MNDTDRIARLEQELRQALSRIDELNAKIETMRGHINGNFNTYASIVSKIVNHTKTPGEFHFYTGIDVGRPH